MLRVKSISEIWPHRPFLFRGTATPAESPHIFPYRPCVLLGNPTSRTVKVLLVAGQRINDQKQGSTGISPGGPVKALPLLWRGFRPWLSTFRMP